MHFPNLIPPDQPHRSQSRVAIAWATAKCSDKGVWTAAQLLELSDNRRGINMSSVKFNDEFIQVLIQNSRYTDDTQPLFSDDVTTLGFASVPRVGEHIEYADTIYAVKAVIHSPEDSAVIVLVTEGAEGWYGESVG